MRRILPSILIPLLLACSLASAQKMPFPQSRSYAGCIRPAVAAKLLNADVITLYEAYKKEFLKKFGSTYYVYAEGSLEDARTVSEQHGYGMMIFALMAGYDPLAKSYFDGMSDFFDDNAIFGGRLMQWDVGGGGGSGSATDGDLDIAYAYLLADAQWGSTGDINYLAQAEKVIEGIEEIEIGSMNRPLLGDWSSDAPENSRPSDWMYDHFRLFADHGTSSLWNAVLNETYESYDEASHGTTGLIADFITGDPAESDPDGGGTPEDQPDTYGMNACRVPWRMAMDYALNGEARAKAGLMKMATWMKGKYTTFNTFPLGPFTIAGNLSTSDNGTAAMYSGPMLCAAIVDPKFQDYLTTGWAFLRCHDGDGTLDDSYNCALKLMSMLLISGNWWQPGDAPSTPPGPVDTVGISFDEFNEAGRGRSDLATAYGTTLADAGLAGGVWQSYTDAYKSSVKTPGGAVLDSNNIGAAVSGGALHVIMTQSTSIPKNQYGTAGIACPILEKDRWVDLSKLSAVGMRIKGTQDYATDIRCNVRFYAITEDVADVSDYGYYGINLSLPANKDTVVWIPAELLSKDPANDLLWNNPLLWWPNGAPTVKQIGFEVLDSASSVDLSIDWIRCAGLGYADLGFTPGLVGTIGASASPYAAGVRRAAGGIDLSLPIPMSSAVLRLYDLRGACVASRSFSGISGIIRLSGDDLGLSSGRYVAEFRCGEGNRQVCSLNLIR